MNDLRFSSLNPLRFPLVMRLYKTHYPAGKPKKDEVIWTGEGTTGLTAAVRFRQFSEFQLLTGMLVIPESRGKGVAEALLSACQSQIICRPCFCLAFRYLVPLYQRAGFDVIERDALPNDLSGRFDSYCHSGKDLVPMKFKKPIRQSETADISETIET
ncbi:GNAT family N-acetyltransferase [Veronia pacifica]|uniref:Acyltransferase n=1 Tax=Veronia pacifica TaxID=1080227 RepID=A0A1C3E6Z4_9GAMM|nr:GNAT family N-acetyltransferase [Veronia pacifica]ODA29025.1 acyltransferase [Veronia pacifica]